MLKGKTRRSTSILSNMLKGILPPLVIILIISFLIINFVTKYSIDKINSNYIETKANCASYNIENYINKYSNAKTVVDKTKEHSLKECVYFGLATEGAKRIKEVLYFRIRQNHNS